MIGLKVKAYRNLNNGMIGLRCATTNKVVGYCTSLVLKDCTAKVQVGTRNTIVKKLNETGKREKNVHAFVIGTIVSIDTRIIMSDIDGIAISYNPYKADHFYNVDTQQAWHTSQFCYFDTCGKGTPLHVIASRN
jgi:hypothetical protein